MKKLLLSMAVVLITQFAFAQDAFKNDMKKFVELSGQRVTFELLTKDIINNIPEAKQAAFKKELDASIDDLMEEMSLMYMQEFTHDEVKEMNKFYETKVGKKLTSKAPVLFEKGQVIGQEWGMGLQGIIAKYMQ